MELPKGRALLYVLGDTGLVQNRSWLMAFTLSESKVFLVKLKDTF